MKHITQSNDPSFYNYERFKLIKQHQILFNTNQFQFKCLLMKITFILKIFLSFGKDGGFRIVICLFFTVLWSDSDNDWYSLIKLVIRLFCSISTEARRWMEYSIYCPKKKKIVRSRWIFGIGLIKISVVSVTHLSSQTSKRQSPPYLIQYPIVRN